VLERKGQRARCELALAKAERALLDAQRVLAEAEATLAQHALQTPSLQAQRSSTGLQLRRAAAFATRHGREATRLRAAMVSATEAVSQADRVVDSARAALAVALGGEQALERDRARHEQDARRQGHALEQQELDEQRASRRPPPPR